MNKRMLTLALALATSMIALPAMAQDNFPDVPENHWAYEALENLKREGILVGYPDGTYKGPRAATRYEMAIALNAAYTRLKSITDGLAEQIAEIRRGMTGGDNSGLADRLTAVENQLRGMGSLRDDVAAMKRMADEFQKELASLGVDVEAMKKDMDEMKKMMAEGRGGAASIKISGDANIVIHAGQSDRATREVVPDGFITTNGGVYGIDGRVLGFTENGDRTSIFGDMNVYHEIAMNIAGTTGVKWDATLVYGNLVGDEVGDEVEGYGNQSGRFQGLGFSEGRGQMYVQRFVIDLSDSLPFKAQVGRMGVQSDNPYLFRRSDNTPYFENSRWDDGNWIFDGALLSFDFGKNSSLVIGGGRNSDRQTDDANELNPVSPGSIGIGGGTSDDQQLVENTFMAQAKVGIGDKGTISGTYLFHSLFGTAGGDRLEILGGQLKYNFTDDVKLTAGYGQTSLKFRNDEIAGFDDDNTAFFGSLDFKVGGLKLNAGYREIQENYIAPGDWERIGTFYSPRGVQDFQVGGTFNLGQNLKLAARGIFGEFIDSNDYNSIKADLHFGFGGGWDAMAGFEQFTIESTGTDARQRWLTFGLRRDLAGGGLFKLVYQYGDHNFGFGNFDLARGALSGTARSRGHILFSQVSVKF